MAHELAALWTSTINSTADGKFDLNNLKDGKNLDGCSHDQQTKLGGSVGRIELPSGAHCYLVKVNETIDQSFFRYRGIAIFNTTSKEFDRIVGVRIKTDLVRSAQVTDLVGVELSFAFAQEEAVWVATKP